jgi:hypothetical protein
MKPNYDTIGEGGVIVRDWNLAVLIDSVYLSREVRSGNSHSYVPTRKKKTRSITSGCRVKAT